MAKAPGPIAPADVLDQSPSEFAPGPSSWRGHVLGSKTQFPSWRVVGQVAGLGLVLLLFDHFIVNPPASGWQELTRHGLGDEVGHLLTAYLWVLAAQVVGIRVALWPALLGGTLIDLDHIPLILGLIPTAHGSSRPISHSLLSVAVLVAFAIHYRRSRRAWLSAAYGLTSHLWRDAGTGAVVFFWPFWREAIRYPYWVYLAGTLLLPLLALAIRSLVVKSNPRPLPVIPNPSPVISSRSEKSRVPNSRQRDSSL